MVAVIPKPRITFFPGLNHTSLYSRYLFPLQEEIAVEEKNKKGIKSSRNAGWGKDQDK